MRLTNYWWLLIWLFGAGGFLYYFFPRQRVNSYGGEEDRWQLLPAVLISAPYVVWAAYRTWFGDTELYRKLFKEAPNSILKLREYVEASTKDQGYSAFMVLFKSILGNSDILFFFIIALFQMACVVWFFRKYSCNYWISFFLFIVSTDYMSWMFNGMRQFIATGLVLIATDFLIRRKYKAMVGIILLAATFHGSALIMLPIMFIVQGKAWNRKTLAFMFLSMLAILYVDRFTPLLKEALLETQYSDMMTNEIWTQDDGTNMLRVLVYSVPAILSLLGIPYLKSHNNRVIDICVNCSIVTMMIYLLSSVTSGIYIGRLPIYTTLQGYIIVPWLIQTMFKKESARMMNLLMMGAYLAFFYFQMHIGWGVL